MCFRLSLLPTVSYLFTLSFHVSNDCNILGFISDSIRTVLSLHLSVNIFIFIDFNAHHDPWIKNYIVIAEVNLQTFNFRHSAIPLLSHLHESWISPLVSPKNLCNGLPYLIYFLSLLLALEDIRTVFWRVRSLCGIYRYLVPIIF